MFRLLDIILSLTGIIICLPFFVIIYVTGLFDTGNPFFKQKRLGKNKVIFKIIKFRTMHVGTSSVATHLVSKHSITKFGGILRNTKLDELPQLWNVLKGDMSLVGPRPSLINQKELIKSREKLDIYNVKPGITGLSQINNIDMSNPELLARKDREMLDEMSLKNYFKYLVLTLLGKRIGDKLIK